QAATAAALAEVLRCGQDMADATDYLEYSVLYQVRSLEPLFALLDDWQRERRFVAMPVRQEQGILPGLVLEKKTALTPELAATQLSNLGAFFMLAADHLRLWHVNSAALAQVRTEAEQRLGPNLALVQSDQGVATFTDLLADMMAFPVHAADQAEAERRV